MVRQVWDDRGRPHARDHAEPERQPTLLAAWRRKRLALQLRWWTDDRSLVLRYTLFAGVFLLAAVFAWGSQAWLVILMIVTIVYWNFVADILPQWRTRVERHSAADPLMCLACGYDLSAIEQESDGCRVCPECGAAWK